MSQHEYPGSDNEVLLSLAQRRDGMMQALDHMRASEERSREEPALRAFGESTLRAMEGNALFSEQLNDSLESFLELRPNLRSEYAVELVWRAAAHRMRFSNRLEYPRVGLHPRECTSVEKWDRFYSWLFEEPKQALATPERQIEFSSDLLRRHVATNIDQRRAGILIAIKAARALEPDLLPKNPLALNIAELGTSTGDILDALIRGVALNLDVRGTERAKKWVGNFGRVAVGRAVGLDLLAPDILWAEACKRPSEQSDAVLFPERKHTPRWPANMSFSETDFSSPHDMLKFRTALEYRNLFIHVTAAIASLYMQTEAEQASSLKEQKKLGASLDIVMDWAKIDPDDSSKLIFSPVLYDKEALPFSLFMRVGQEFAKLGEFNGRATKFAPSEFLSALIADSPIASVA